MKVNQCQKQMHTVLYAVYSKVVILMRLSSKFVLKKIQNI